MALELGTAGYAPTLKSRYGLASLFGKNVSSLLVSKMIDMKARLGVVMGSIAAGVVLLLAFWGAYSFAYHRGFDRGYAQGGRDEFLRWKQEPTSAGKDRDGTITGHRNMKQAAVKLSWSKSVNTWSAPFIATGAVSVSASRAPSK